MKKKQIRQAMILSAGLGTRLLPITETLPKPLVPVLNVSNILHIVFLLRQCGVKEIVINVYHLPKVMESFLGDGKEWGIRIYYSRENILLGTGGGLKKAEEFLEDETFVLANGDFVTNVELSPFIERHLERKALATMLLIEDSERQPFYSAVGVDSDERLVSLPRTTVRAPEKVGIFTGIHILNRKVFSHLDEVPCGINEVLYPSLMKEKPKKVYGDFLGGSEFWLETGDLSNYFKTNLMLLNEVGRGAHPMRLFLQDIGGYREKKPGLWAKGGQKLKNVEWKGPVILGEGCEFSAGVQLSQSILGDRTRVVEKTALSNLITLGNCEIHHSLRGGILFQETFLPM